jgi:hypothetical protein
VPEFSRSCQKPTIETTIAFHRRKGSRAINETTIEQPLINKGNKDDKDKTWHRTKRLEAIQSQFGKLKKNSDNYVWGRP